MATDLRVEAVPDEGLGEQARGGPAAGVLVLGAPTATGRTTEASL